jgi:hypothetical protein
MASKLTSTSAEEIFPRNTLRKSFVIQNEDSAINVFIKRERGGGNTVSSTDHDHRVGPAGLISVNNLTDGTEAIQDRWTVVAESGTPRVSYFETEDIKR